MQKLASLNVDANGITVIPGNIKKMVSLRWLKLCRNEITVIPDEVGDLLDFHELEFLQVKGNPLEVPPIELFAGDTGGNETAGEETGRIVKEYRNGSQKREILTIRVLGDGKAGKSTFISSFITFLKERKVVFTEESHISTRGVFVREIKRENLTLRFLEFGGQPQYLPIHRSFIDSSRSLYVVLFKADDVNGYNSATFWLDYVASLRLYRGQNDGHRSDLVLVSTHNDKLTAAEQSLDQARSLMQRFVEDNSYIGEDRCRRFRFNTSHAFDLDYCKEEQTLELFRFLEGLSTTTAGKLDSIPTSFAQILSLCDEIVNDNEELSKQKILNIKSLEQRYEKRRGQNPGAPGQGCQVLYDALNFFTQMGDLVYVEDTGHVFRDPMSLFTAMGTVANNPSIQLHGGVCSAKSVSKILNQRKETTDSMLEAMRCLNFCFPVPPVSVQFSEASTAWVVKHDDRKAIGDQQDCDSTQPRHWMFPASRSDGSTLQKILLVLDKTFQLDVRPQKYGVCFKTRSGFFPPGLLSLLECRLRFIGAIIHVTGNTLALCLSTRNRVVLHYDASGQSPRIDCAVFSDDLFDCRLVIDTIAVTLSRSIDLHYPQLVLEEYALCPNCLREEDICSLDGLVRLDRSAGSGEYSRYWLDSTPENPYQCGNLSSFVTTKQLIPLVEERSAWRSEWQFDVMISHAGEDTSLALDIFKWLSNVGVSCF